MLIEKDQYDCILLIVLIGVGKILFGFLFSLIEFVEIYGMSEFVEMVDDGVLIEVFEMRQFFGLREIDEYVEIKVIDRQVKKGKEKGGFNGLYIFYILLFKVFM